MAISPTIYNVSSILKRQFLERLIKLTGKKEQRKGQRLVSAREISEGLAEFRKELLHKLIDSYSREAVNPLFESVRSNINQLIKACGSNRYKIAIDVGLELRTRLLIGTGDPYTRGVLDIGLSWDPYSNLPYIPSTSLKGAFRSAASLLGSKCVKDFGEPGSASNIIVLDSYPIDCKDRLLDIDIINPHYKEPEGKISETKVSPTPLLFLTVRPGTIFRFVILKSRRSPSVCDSRRLFELLRFVLENGIGAKTSLAYGRFKIGTGGVQVE